jgi:hypothetical protein
MLLNNKVYNTAKWASLTLLPAVATLYFTLGSVWDLPNVEQVIGSITAVETFLGLLLGLSTRKYNQTANVIDGDLIVSEVDGEKFLSLGVNGSVEKMTSKGEVRLKVVPHNDSVPE